MCNLLQHVDDMSALEKRAIESRGGNGKASPLFSLVLHSSQLTVGSWPVGQRAFLRTCHRSASIAVDDLRNTSSTLISGAKASMLEIAIVGGETIF